MGGHNSRNLFPGTSGSAASSTSSEQSHIDDAPSGINGLPPNSTRARLLSDAKTAQAKGIINELYRPGSNEGDGGTADAIRRQRGTGEPAEGKDQIKKDANAYGKSRNYSRKTRVILIALFS